MQRYSVVPLSTNSGLIEWVPQCDTLHALVRDYRLRRNIMINVEHRLMLHYAPDLDSLSLMQKVEVFKYALANTEGMDLYRVLWMKVRARGSRGGGRANGRVGLGSVRGMKALVRDVANPNPNPNPDPIPDP